MDLKTLIAKRGQLKAQVTKFKNYLNDPNKQLNLVQIRLRKNKIEECWDAFQQIQSNVEILDENNDVQLKERDEFENSYFQSLEKAENLIDEFLRINASPVRSNHIESDESHRKNPIVKLPPLNVPQFNGHYESWLAFYDLYISLIHDNPDLSDIERFYYLKSALIGEAAQVIQSLELTKANYAVAWKLLLDRYHREKIIIQKHIKALFNLNKIEKEHPVALRHLLDNSLKHIRALGALGQPVHSWDTLLIYLIANKLDAVTFRDWQNNTSNEQIETLQDLTNFLQERCRVLDAIHATKDQITQPSISSFMRNNYPSQIRKNQASISCISTNSDKCAMCLQPHSIINCKQFMNLNSKNRFNKIKSFGLCVNCLKSGHKTSQCNFIGCEKCGGRHHVLLHFKDADKTQDKLKQETVPSTMTSTSHNKISLENVEPVVSCSSQNLNLSSQVILPTALIDVMDKNNCRITCKALLDSGSQSSYISESLSQRLGLSRKRVHSPITGINGSITTATYKLKTTIYSRCSKYHEEVEFFVLPKITDNLPTVKMDIKNYMIPTYVNLADPTFHSPSKIDLLIGADLFWDIFGQGEMTLSNDFPKLRETKLGWIIGGRLQQATTSDRTKCYLTTSKSLDLDLKRFPEVEQYDVLCKLSSDEQPCESFYQDTTSRLDNGRYVIKMPFKFDTSNLSESKESALKRFLLLERKFGMDPND